MKVKSKTPAKRSRPRSRKAAGGGILVDGHLNMIANPCHAPLVESTCSTLASLRQRFRSVYNPSVVNSGTVATQFYSVYAYHPVFGSYVMTSADNAATSFAIYSDFPGSPLVTDSPARGVGACVSVSWTDQEIYRRGVVRYGILPGGFVHDYMPTTIGGNGQTITPTDLATRLSGLCRMPNDKCEITWVPTDADEELMMRQTYNSGSAPALGNLMTRCNFVVIYVQYVLNAGNTSTHTFDTTAILEWNPENQNMVLDSAHVTLRRTGTKITDLIRILQSRDSAWYVDAFRKMARITGRALGAYARGGVLGLTAEVAGMVIQPRKNVGS